MISRTLNSNHDIFSQNGRVSFIQTVDEVAQHIKTRLLLFLGEWFLDVEEGTPWFEQIFIKPADVVQVEVIIKNRILQTENVKELLTFDLEFNTVTRALSITFSCNTVYGETNEIEIELNV